MLTARRALRTRALRVLRMQARLWAGGVLVAASWRCVYHVGVAKSNDFAFVSRIDSVAWKANDTLVFILLSDVFEASVAQFAGAMWVC